jgi:hypothetical protein
MNFKEEGERRPDDAGDDLEGGRPTAGRSDGKPSRATAVLSHGRSVIVVDHDQTLESWMDALTLALSHARYARAQNLTLDGFLKLLRQMKQE